MSTAPSRYPDAATPPRFIAYVRVSTGEQAASGLSLAAQRRRLTAYVAAHGLTLADVAEDAGISARRTNNRPALQRALSALSRGEADGLVAVKLDRLSRTTRDVLDLVARAEREGWALHSIEERLDTASPQGRFVTTSLGAMAQLKREQAAERTRVAMAELRRQGRRVSGKPPWGYRFDCGRVVADTDEQVILTRMLVLRAEGLGAKRIAAALNEAGGTNPRTNRAWTHGAIQAVLRRIEAAA